MCIRGSLSIVTDRLHILGPCTLECGVRKYDYYILYLRACLVSSPPLQPQNKMDKPTPRATNAEFATVSPRTGLLSPPLTPEMDPPPEIKVSSPVDGPPSPPTTSHSRTTSYNNYTPVGENIPLTDRHMSIALADQYLMKHQEQDAKLKKFIRRFRFCIRSLSLGCRLIIRVIRWLI